jgi:hypothetical protein
MKQHHRRRIVATLAAAALAFPGGAFAGTPQTERPTVVVEVRDGGFHWGDAAIGASGALALVLLSGTALLRRRAAREQPERSNHA